MASPKKTGVDSEEQVPRVTIITLNWNGKADTIDCVASLRKLNYTNFDIIVVDNGSTDGSKSTILARFPDITVLENARNLGYARGFNSGLRYAYEHGADYFLVVNSDTTVDPEALRELIEAAEQDEKIGFASGKVYWHERPDVLQTAGRESDPLTLVGRHIGSGEVDRGQFDVIRDLDFVDDVFLLVRRRVYEVVGGYDPMFFLYFEETDWCVRVRRAGFRIVYVPGARIWHKGIVGESNVMLSPRRIFYLKRFQIPFMRRHASPEQWNAYVRAVLIGLPHRILGYVKHGRFGAMMAYLRALVIGFAGLLRGSHSG